MTKQKTFGRSRPSLGYELEYRRRLQAGIKAMQEDVEKELKAYLESEVVMDSASILWTQIMKVLRKKWYKHFNDIGKEMTKWFMAKADKRTKKQIVTKLKQIGWTIEPHYTEEQKKIIRKLSKESVSYIKSIPQKYLQGVQKSVSEAFLAGGDRETLTKELKRVYKEIGRRNKSIDNYAKLVARDQSNKVTQNFAIINAQSYGAKKARWIHVPGVYSSRETHIHMDRKTFELAKGMYDPAVGRYVKPAELPYCQCQFEVLMPGFED